MYKKNPFLIKLKRIHTGTYNIYILYIYILLIICVGNVINAFFLKEAKCKRHTSHTPPHHGPAGGSVKHTVSALILMAVMANEHHNMALLFSCLLELDIVFLAVSSFHFLHWKVTSQVGVSLFLHQPFACCFCELFPPPWSPITCLSLQIHFINWNTHCNMHPLCSSCVCTCPLCISPVKSIETSPRASCRKFC